MNQMHTRRHVKKKKTEIGNPVLGKKKKKLAKP